MMGSQGVEELLEAYKAWNARVERQRSAASAETLIGARHAALPQYAWRSIRKLRNWARGTNLIRTRIHDEYFVAIKLLYTWITSDIV